MAVKTVVILLIRAVLCLEFFMRPDSLLAPNATVYGVIMNDQITLDRFGDVSQAPYKGAAKAPILYIKPVNTWCGNGAIIDLPRNENTVEVGAVIGLRMGRDASRLDEDNALDAVKDCVLAADLSLPHDSYYRPAIRQKAFDGALPLLNLPAEILANLNNLTINTFINDDLKDTRKMNNLVRSPAKLLADVTEFMTLFAGDVLLLGVVYKSPLASLGDHIKVEIPGLQELQFSLAKEDQV